MTPDDLDWSEPPPPSRQHPPGRVKEFVTLLRTRPGQWAKYPHPYSPGSVRYMVNKYPKRYVDTEWCSRVVNDEKVLWARWVGEP